MKKYTGLLVLVALGVGIIILANSNANYSGRAAVLSSQSKTIPIGGIMILSGQGASWGEASRNGMELAIKDINEHGGVNGKQLRGIYEDDQSSPEKALAALNKLTGSDHVKFIIGTNWSNTGVAVQKPAADAKVVMISPSLGVKEFNESSPYLFNTWPHDEILSAKLGDIVYDKGYRHVALFGATDVFVKAQTAAFKQEFEARGGTIEMLYEPTDDTTDERTQVQKVLANKKVDAVVMTTDGLNLTVVTARQMHELGSTLPMFNITVDKKILADCGSNCDGMLFPTSLTPTPAFNAEYKAAYNQEVEIGADSAYDAVTMIAEAMRATHSEDPDKVKDYLASIKTYHGVSGDLISDGKRGFTKGYALKRVQNGIPYTVEN
jgi:branched-chain amino acid transport system substrate-binding protein